jgi:hypothetical protein
MAAIGAKRATPSATSVTMPIPGILLMSSGDRRIKRNRSQTTAQIARQDIDAVRNGALTISVLVIVLQKLVVTASEHLSVRRKVTPQNPVRCDGSKEARFAGSVVG